MQVPFFDFGLITDYLFIKVITKNNMEKITIANREFNIKYTIRALFIFEQITKKPFKIESLLDNYIFFYSMILANNKDNVLEWDAFIDAIDADPTLFNKMSDIVTAQQRKNELFEGDEEEGEEEKKS